MYLRLMYTLIYLAISSLLILWSDYFPFCCCYRSIFYQIVVPLEFCFKLALNRWQKDCDWWFNNLRSHELSAHNDFWKLCIMQHIYFKFNLAPRLGFPGGSETPEVGGSFGISVNPIWTKGGRLCPPYYYVPPPIFYDNVASLAKWKEMTQLFTAVWSLFILDHSIQLSLMPHPNTRGAYFESFVSDQLFSVLLVDYN